MAEDGNDMEQHTDQEETAIQEEKVFSEPIKVENQLYRYDYESSIKNFEIPIPKVIISRAVQNPLFPSNEVMSENDDVCVTPQIIEGSWRVMAEETLTSHDPSDSSGSATAQHCPTREAKRLEELKNASEKIKSGEWELVPNPKPTRKSNVWEIFYIARDPESKRLVNFAQCQRCLTVKAYVFGSTTTSLMRHYTECIKNGAQDGSGSSARHKPVNSETREEFKDVLIDFCVGDIRPFSVVESANFAKVIQKAINLGAEHGQVNAEDVIPSATTISSDVKVKADEAREKLKPKILNALKAGILSATVDMWVEDCTKCHFMTLTVHFINDDWRLESYNLFTCVFPYDSADAVNIRRGLLENLEKFGISEEDGKQINFVTDGGTNVVKALEDFPKLYCTAHWLNSISTHVSTVKLSERNLFGNNGKEIVGRIETFFNLLNKKLNKEVPKNLPLVNDASINRYESKLPKLLPFPEQYTENPTTGTVEPKCLAMRPADRAKDIDSKLQVDQLVEYLEPFETETERLVSEKQPTAQFVLLTYHRLVKHCAPREGDSSMIAGLKEKCLEELRVRVVVQDHHKIATFLWPQFRRLQMLSGDERNRIWNLVRELISDPIPENTGTSEPPHKKACFEWDDYSEWCASEVDEEVACDEVAMYLKNSMSPVPPADLLDFWSKGRGGQFPKLRALARRILGVPATCAASERVFGLAGHTYAKRRSSLDPNVVDDYLLYFSFLQNGNVLK